MMKCYFCGSFEQLDGAILSLWSKEQTVALCPACTKALNGKKIVIHFRAFQESLSRYFDEKELEEILACRCPSCFLKLGELIASEKAGCIECLDRFTPVVMNLVNYLEEARAYILRPENSMPAVDAGKKAVMSAALENLDHDPDFQVRHLRERLEALLQEEKYEDAKTLAEMIKKLEPHDPGNPGSGTSVVST